MYIFEETKTVIIFGNFKQIIPEALALTQRMPLFISLNVVQGGLIGHSSYSADK